MSDPDGRTERAGDADRAAPLGTRVATAAPRGTAAVATLFLFVFAVQLLGTATEAAAPLLERVLRPVVVGDASALGLGWLAAYGLTNGSVVAALSVSLLGADVVTTSEGFLLVSGSRLGGAGVVVLVGALDYAGKRGPGTLREGTSLGLLTFLLTLSIYGPVTVLGYLLWPVVRGPLQAAVVTADPSVGALRVFDPACCAVVDAVGAVPALVVAIALLFGSLQLFDRVLSGVEPETLRSSVFRHFRRRWTAFLVGLVVTGATTSVAFSLGVVVPLYNRRFVKRSEMVPYVLGANVGTLLDTLLVAFVLESAAGVAVVVLVMALATGLTLAALVVYGPYAAAVDAAQDRLLGNRRALFVFAGLLVAVPLALVAVAHVP